METKMDRMLSFLDETVEYFISKSRDVDRDRYFADRDIRYILDKAVNDIILCLADISEEVLKSKGRSVPDSYKDTILACHEFIGDIALKVAPLTKHRNEIVHQYLKVNWQNIVTVKNKISEIKEFADKIKGIHVL